MAVPAGPLQAPDRVLPTLNQDGTRRWIRPKPSHGRWNRRRQITAYALMLVFFAIPYLQMNGKPVVLLDLPRREFTLLGTTFLSTDTLLFMLLLLGALIGVFYATALFGRVWCGWACPQTVYLEYLFRPIERFFEGGWRGSIQMDKTRSLHPWRWVKYGVYLLLAIFLSHTFLGYFVGIETLKVWIQRSPVEHPVSFLVMLGTTAAIFLDFAWFREQTCLVACPYGRLQSVLLDRRSLIVAYDPGRGEPRAKGHKTRPATSGDCVDCNMCVKTCPTGIDIRQGLQMECIHCTQCVDACDTVMVKIGKPPGLIRYSSQAELTGQRASMPRVRTVIYPLALAITLGLFVTLLVMRGDTEVTVLRSLDAPYVIQPDGSVLNQVRIKITNHGSRDRRYRIEMLGAAEASVVVPINPLPIPAGRTQTTTMFVTLPATGYPGGLRSVNLHVADDGDFHAEVPWGLPGPAVAAGHR